MPFRIASLATGLVLALAAPAAAADHCVGVERPDCTDAVTLSEALEAAADGDRIFVGGELEPRAGDSAFADAGTRVSIAGTAGATLLAPLELTADGSRVGGLVIAPASGSDAALLVDAAAVRADSVDVRRRPGAPAVEVRCSALADGELVGRHLTIDGPALAACAQPMTRATLDLHSSVLDAADPFHVQGGTVVTDHSAHLDDADAIATDRIDGDPLLDDDRRPQAGSPLIDAADPAPLAAGEPFEDADQLPRIADGDGDGTLRRDAGAYERQPPAVPISAGNVLTNPGAEEGLAGWTGTYETAPFGDPFFPSRAAGAALSAGGRFFAGGAAAEPVAVQRIGMTASAAAIDTGQANARLSGLLGGYGGEDDGDSVTVRASFLDPEGHPVAPDLVIGPVTAADRANVTSLLFRAAAGAIPARTRAIDVSIAGRRGTGQYTDAYADNLGLELSVPGVPVDPQDPIVPNLRPFAGVTVLHPDAQVTRKGTVRVALACASATVRSCSGTLELRARLPRAKAATRIGRIAPFAVMPGRRRGVIVKLLAASRRALARRTSIRATLRAVAADGQGVQRTRTVPLKLRLPRRR